MEVKVASEDLISSLSGQHHLDAHGLVRVSKGVLNSLLVEGVKEESTMDWTRSHLDLSAHQEHRC
jgi:hypothetical protein